MAPSLFKSLYILGGALFYGLSSADQHLNWTVEWLLRNPDGMMMRPVQGINGQWPLPALTVTKGERLIVNVHNNLGNQSTSIHWHGIFQFGTPHMDGAVGATQCGIPPGGSMTYNFTIDRQAGSYWYHSHERGQYPDGLRGALIVKDPQGPYEGMYDEEIVLTLSDWYHNQMPDLLSSFISVTNPTGAEPVPKSALMNDTQNQKIMVKPNTTYYIHVVNVAAFAAQYFSIQGHTMKIIEVDGVYTEPAEAEMIYVTAAQRYGVLVTTKDNMDANFAIMGNMDQDLFDTVPPELNPNVTSYLVYDDSKPLPEPTLYDEYHDFDDFNLVPQDRMPLLDGPNIKQFTVDIKMDNLGDGANYAFFNDTTYVVPKVPTIITALTTGQTATNPAIYGVNANPLILNQGDIVEVILNNQDPGKHPFHLHGHYFQAVLRSEDEAGDYTGGGNYSQIPMRRDTLLVRPDGHFIIRYKAENPGIWLFHCHIEWHVASGLTLSFVEAPLEIQAQLGSTLPQDMLDNCNAQGIATKGNAAGNDQDLFDLNGAAVSPAPLPAGFTARGIVALVFSCVSAFLGLAVISWYGVQPIGAGEYASARKRIAEAGVQ